MLHFTKCINLREKCEKKAMVTLYDREKAKYLLTMKIPRK